MHPSRPERVMAPEAAEAIRQALMAVVKSGTANGLLGAYLNAQGTPMPVGGKTGTGDNRLDAFASDGGISLIPPGGSHSNVRLFSHFDRFYGTMLLHHTSAPGPRLANMSSPARSLCKC